LFFVVWRISANPNVIATIDRSLNGRLQKGHLFKIIRLVLLLAFGFSVIVVAFAFVSPIAMRIADSKHLDIASKAFENLRAQNYVDARRQYKRALEDATDESTSDKIRGMITATYYGQGLHREGLNFICEAYKARAVGDTRHVFAIHAHLRAIRRKEGVPAAETLASNMRRSCGRSDFTEIWAHVPLGLMEMVNNGVPMAEHSYKLSKEDTENLQRTILEKAKEAVNGPLPFHDFAIYFQRDFGGVIQRFPKSTLRHLALYDFAGEATGAEKIARIRTFLSEFPLDSRAPLMYQSLISELVQTGQTEEALGYVAKMDESAKNEAIDRILDPTFDASVKLQNEGDFKAALAILVNSCKLFAARGMDCDRSAERRKSLALAVPLTESLEPSDKCVNSFVKLRSADNQFLRGARAVLDKCLSRLQADPVEAAKALYLLASASRSLGEYDRSADYLLRLVRGYPNHDLYDDALAELGFHYSMVAGNWPMAQTYLNEVVTKYSDRNAYDNALWWLARGHRDRGNYVEAMKYYGMIVSWKAESRFKQWSSDETTGLNKLSTMAPLAGASLALRPGEYYKGLFVGSVAPNSSAKALGLEVGDRLLSFCGVKNPSLSDMLSKLGKPDLPLNCELNFGRGQFLLITFNGSGSDPKRWIMKRGKAPAEQGI
jgi:tetratricopeptide (TPR) repeat protein